MILEKRRKDKQINYRYCVEEEAVGHSFEYSRLLKLVSLNV